MYCYQNASIYYELLLSTQLSVIARQEVNFIYLQNGYSFIRGDLVLGLDEEEHQYFEIY